MLTTVLNSQKIIDTLTHLKYDTNEVIPIMFSIYLNDKKIDKDYYFSMDVQSKDLCFETVQSNLFVCILNRNERYKFSFKDKNSKPFYVSLDTFMDRRAIYNIRLYTTKKYNTYQRIIY